MIGTVSGLLWALVGLSLICCVCAYDTVLAEDTFAQMDANGDSAVTLEEASAYLKESTSSEEIAKYFHAADTDESGRVSLAEFTTAMRAHSIALDNTDSADILRDQTSSNGGAGEMRFAKLKAKTAIRARAHSTALATSLATVTARKGESAPAPTPCDGSDCSNHGSASGNKGGCSCRCNTGWQGARCESAIWSITVQVDDDFSVYLDGVRVGGGNSWPTPYTFVWGSTPNQIVIHGHNGGGPAGILASTSTGLVTDTSWRCGNFGSGLPGGVLDAGYSTRSNRWNFATSVGANGATTWGYQKAVSGSARWIWESASWTSWSTCVWQRECTAADCNNRATDSDFGTVRGGCSCKGCLEGWRGARCEIAREVCTPANTCAGRGTTSGYKDTGCAACKCQPQYGGSDCRYEFCTASDCNNHGNPTGYRDSCSCGCVDGWTGPRCNTAPVPCDASDCNNAGTPSNFRYQRCKCACKPGYNGEFCQTPPVPCDGTDCNRNGNADGFRFSGCKCRCTNGFSGNTCDTPPDPCAGITCSRLDTCHMVGTCTKGVCSNPLMAEGAECDDDNSRTVDDKCTKGVCKGTDPCSSFVCTSTDPCKKAVGCELRNNRPNCLFDDMPDGTACNDNNINTKNDACAQGICRGKDLCWDVLCEPISQCHAKGDCTNGLCAHPKLKEGTICDDKNPKTGGDHCDADAQCVGTLEPVDGGLSEWSACTVGCGGGTQTRQCNTPAPANGGKPCCGGNFGKSGCPDIQVCNSQVCASVLQAAIAAKQAAEAGPVTACSAKPCKNDGKCVLTTSDPDGFHCDCFPGWSGTDCSVSQTGVEHTEQEYNSGDKRVKRIEDINDETLGVPRWYEQQKVLSEWRQFSDKDDLE